MTLSLAIQILCCLALLFGDIGFDKPGRYGLGFPALVLIVVVYGVSLLSGLFLGIQAKRWVPVGMQLLPLVLGLVSLGWPQGTYDPARYQDLVGKPKSELDRRLGRPRGSASGFTSDERHRDVEFLQLPGMIVYISRDGIVESVEAFPR